MTSLGFAAVGPDVLHRRRARLARYEREVFDAPQAASDGPFHQVVPFDARVHAYAHPLAVVFRHFDFLRHGVSSSPS